ncbi:MAG: RNA-binding transcriptional accessory protein [Myxococcales bacterium]|nr:RNA-binding transcriptional accessory protein [Myxococcales bacterium]
MSETPDSTRPQKQATLVFDPVPQIARELSLSERSVAAVVQLLADDNTVPFIARYRKEATGGLDEVQIRTIEERRGYLRDLEERRAAILASVAEQGKLSDALRARIEAAETKAQLEDLYLPYKPKRRTRATIARERGLEPLAERILAQPADGAPERDAAAFVDPSKEVADVEAALAGARDIVAEVIAETADVRQMVREALLDEGMLVAEATPDAQKKRTKYEQYYDFREAVQRIPSHRFLAIRRGEREGALKVHVDLDAEPLLARIEAKVGRDERSAYAAQLREAIGDGYRRLLAPGVETDVRVQLKQSSDREAVDVFADNLRPLLMAPPLGTKNVIGVDPGLRTGCKCAAVDSTGKFLATITVYLTRGDAAVERARKELADFVRAHAPVAIAVGNGTGGRETEAFVRELCKAEGFDCFVVQVNESGASVYSASDTARDEFPQLDVTVRGAISIARRLQDPLAELVKIEPKAIGVGQYQHDVHQPLLTRKLGEVVESCVNHVGVELNTASASLLGYVAGIGKSLAKKIVKHREQSGAFDARARLLDVSGLGPRAYEQAAGFLRISGGGHPLDASAVHPERYALVERMARDLGVALPELVGNAEQVARIDIARYVSGDVGEPTLRDIVDELKKPGRDPRDEFSPPKFREDVTKLEDLQEGMVLEGVVTNVTAFGAFVDVGVHQDGLVHVSQLADRFVKDPHEVAKVGQKLTVRVIGVDLERKRISLSARSEGGGERSERNERPRDDRPRGDRPRGDRPRSDRPRGDRPRSDRPRGGKRDDKRADRGGKGGTPKPKGGFSNNPFAKLANLKVDD